MTKDNNLMNHVAVIGGGAAGYFAAISCKTHHPEAEVTIYEKTAKTLAKVKISGGGRCNVTNACFEPAALLKNYPRGAKSLKKVFQVFSTKDTVHWFESRGVPLKTEPDHRMFPQSDQSQSVVDCLEDARKQLGINLRTQCALIGIVPQKTGFRLTLKDGTTNLMTNKVIIASGGSPKIDGLQWLAELGHKVNPPVPSLFTFNMPSEPCQKLMGLSVPEVTVKIAGASLQQKGPLLFTHWGMSGPAVLKLSAWGAREFSDRKYNFTLLANWLADTSEAQLREKLEDIFPQIQKRKVANKNPFGLPQRLWDLLLERTGISPDSTWMALNKKDKNRLINTLICDSYQVSGKTTFKEEFVTCGGVSTEDVDFGTMQSKKVPGMYFAGEVLDVDGVTGGFNFQAAWSTGFVAGKLG